jgi:anti-sigma regulatory factor (Ser/Thr protein kinase)
VPAPADGWHPLTHPLRPFGHHRAVRHDTGSERPPRELRVRLAADPVSVAGARRFVADGLASCGLEVLVEDAKLCVSELAANATLHSASTFMEVAVLPLGDAVRLSVEDDGDVSAAAVMPRVEPPSSGEDSDTRLDEQATTGRGLVIVSILASDWGVEQTGHGKRVWARLDGGGQENVVRPPVTDVEQPSPPEGASLPSGWGMVRLVGCPVRLSLRQDEHLDELIRELQLISGDVDRPRSRDLALQMQGLLSEPAHARHTGRRIAQQAAAAGLEHIDIDMAMPVEYAREVRALQDAVRAADVLCEEMRLLTLASSADLRNLRAWMAFQVSSQLEEGAAPVSWTDWLAAGNRRDAMGDRFRP